jgi:hypothetical protein
MDGPGGGCGGCSAGGGLLLIITAGWPFRRVGTHVSLFRAAHSRAKSDMVVVASGGAFVSESSVRGEPPTRRTTKVRSVKNAASALHIIISATHKTQKITTRALNLIRPQENIILREPYGRYITQSSALF